MPVLRAVREAIADRPAGPLLLNRHGERRSRQAAAGLVSGVPLRDMQYAMRHADSRTTLRYDMACTKLDRHAARAVAAYLAGMSAD